MCVRLCMCVRVCMFVYACVFGVLLIPLLEIDLNLYILRRERLSYPMCICIYLKKIACTCVCVSVCMCLRVCVWKHIKYV